MVRSMCSEVNDGNSSSSGINMAEMAPILKSIIVTRTKFGATIDEIIADYYEFTGDNLLSICDQNRDAIGNLLRKIDGVWCMYKSPSGPYIWFCSSQNTKHLTEMIRKQKSPRYQNQMFQEPRQTTSTYKAQTNSETVPREKFYQDNINFIPKRNAWNRASHRTWASHPYMGAPQWRQIQQFKPMRMPMRMYNPIMQPIPNYYLNNASGPTFCGLQMVGDDFFLSLARWELGFRFDPGHGIQQSGLCVSGLTIAEAADRVTKAPVLNERVLFNVGIVDLLHGHDIVDMQQDLLQLLKNLENRGASAILTTLSPIANMSHVSGITDRLNKFNELIRKLQRPYIDVWKCFVNERNQTLYACFQPGPRLVSGSNKPHVLWNKLGRQRVIKYIKTELAALI